MVGSTSTCWTAKQPRHDLVSFQPSLGEKESQTSEWTGNRVVPTANGADVASRRSGTLHVGRHRDGNVEILSLGLRDAIDAWHVVGDLESLADETRIARLINVANIRASTVGVDLVDCHDYVTPGPDLGDGLCRQSSFRVFGNVNIASQLCSPALVDKVGLDLGIANDGCI